MSNKRETIAYNMLQRSISVIEKKLIEIQMQITQISRIGLWQMYKLWPRIFRISCIALQRILQT